MALVNAFGDISLEATQVQIRDLQQQVRDLTDSINTLVQFLYANSPRVDAAQRIVGNNSETTQPISGSLTAVTTVSTVTTVGSVTALANITAAGGLPYGQAPLDCPLHIYDNVKVS